MAGREIDINSLYGMVLRDAEGDSVQELEAGIYQSISEFLGRLKRQEYDNVEGQIKDAMIIIATDLTAQLLGMRLDKASRGEEINYENLLDEEKFILDAGGEMGERREMILSGILNGKSKLLESVAQRHKTKIVAVRFLKEMDRFVGADLERYGPFRPEDIATIPYENAQAMLDKKIIAKIRWED